MKWITLVASGEDAYRRNLYNNNYCIGHSLLQQHCNKSIIVVNIIIIGQIVISIIKFNSVSTVMNKINICMLMSFQPEFTRWQFLLAKTQNSVVVNKFLACSFSVRVHIVCTFM